MDTIRIMGDRFSYSLRTSSGLRRLLISLIASGVAYLVIQESGFDPRIGALAVVFVAAILMGVLSKARTRLN